MHYHNCRNQAKVNREGKPFCIVHDPVRLKKKNDERVKKWDAEWARKERLWELEARANKLLKRLLTCPDRDIVNVVNRWRTVARQHTAQEKR